MSKRIHELWRLTIREVEVLNLVAQGMSAKEVADYLCIATSTVERHVENARLKTRTRNRAHMIAHVIQLGILDLGAADSSVKRPVRSSDETEEE
jgi:LuxR family transcriptional regulator, transcriptional regulator of spore coat protein